jgi:hypothetical protein
MFDPRFKSMWLVTTFLGDENVVAIVVEYDKKLLLHLLTKAIKLLMHTNVEEVENLQSKGNSKDLFKTTSTNANTYMDLVSRELFGFHRVSIDAENDKCVLF